MSDKIRILFLAPHLSTGGMPSFLLRRIESIVNCPDFEIFVVEYSNLSDEYVVQKNKIKDLIKPENFFTLDDNKYHLINIIKEKNIDIVHSDEIMEGFGDHVPDVIMNDLFSNERTWKMIETCHNVWFNPKSNKRFNPDAYAFCTPYHQQVTFFDMPSYSEVLQFPIENKVPSQSEKTESKLKLGFDLTKKHIINVGLWTGGKNQGEGLEIARLLEITNPEIQFHFIGNQAPNFEDYWGPLMQNVPSNVKICGERADVDEFMKAADIFMFNSTWECNPLVLREATSYGLKIISRNLPQYLDMFTPYITEIKGGISNTKDDILKMLSNNNRYDVVDQSGLYSERNINFYKKVHNMPKIENNKFIPKPEITVNFIGQPFIEIKGISNSKFKIEFFDEQQKCHYREILPINHWVKLNREYFTKWNIKVWQDDSLIYDYTLNLKDKRVYISLESRSLGDTLAWLPYVKEFKEKHQCKLIVSTFMNDLFKDNYPDIEFTNPGMPVHGIFAMYKLGWFYNDSGEYNQSRNPNDFRNQPMQKTASDILGLEFKESKPLINIPQVEKKKKVGIGLHSTCQAKYWNNPIGWQSVVDYLLNLGYEVVIYSRENDGYMGNFHPKGASKFESGSIERLIEDMSSCEFFIGLGSGLSWLAWSINLPVVLISGFSDDFSETISNTYRVINKSVCHGCFNRHKLDAGDWNWCPDHKGTDRQFECSKSITPEMVVEQINKIIYEETSSI